MSTSSGGRCAPPTSDSDESSAGHPGKASCLKHQIPFQSHLTLRLITMCTLTFALRDGAVDLVSRRCEVDSHCTVLATSQLKHWTFKTHHPIQYGCCYGSFLSIIYIFTKIIYCTSQMYTYNVHVHAVCACGFLSRCSCLLVSVYIYDCVHPCTAYTCT